MLVELRLRVQAAAGVVEVDVAARVEAGVLASRAARRGPRSRRTRGGPARNAASAASAPGRAERRPVSSVDSGSFRRPRWGGEPLAGGRAGSSHTPPAQISKFGSSPLQPRRTRHAWSWQPRQRPRADSNHISVRQTRQIVRGRRPRTPLFVIIVIENDSARPSDQAKRFGLADTQSGGRRRVSARGHDAGGAAAEPERQADQELDEEEARRRPAAGRTAASK